MTNFLSNLTLGKMSHETGISDVRLENSDTEGPNLAPDNVSSSQLVAYSDGAHKPAVSKPGFFSGLPSRIRSGIGWVFGSSSEPPVKLSSHELYQQSIRRRNDYENRKKGLSDVQCEVHYHHFSDMNFLRFPRGKNKVSKREIEHNFRIASRKYHTDKWGGSNDGFQKLSDAKESLLRMVEESVVDDMGKSMTQLGELIAKEEKAIERHEKNEKFDKDCQEARAAIGELENAAEQRAHKIRVLQSKIDNLLGVIKEHGVDVDEAAEQYVGPSLRYDRNLTMFQSDTDVSDSDSDSTELDLYWRDAHGYNDTPSQDGNPS